MASIEQGFAGYSKINPYGETANRVWAKMENQGLGSIGTGASASMRWTRVESDEFNMVVYGSLGQGYGFLIPEGGLWEITLNQTTSANAGTPNVSIQVITTRSWFFDGSNEIAGGPDGNAAVIGRSQITQGGGGYFVESVISRRVWLEKGAVIFATMASDSNVTLIQNTTLGQNTFEIRLISQDQILSTFGRP